MKQKSKITGGILLLLGIGGAITLYQGVQRWNRAHAAGSSTDSAAAGAGGLAELSAPETLRVSSDGMKDFGIETVEVKPVPPPEPLRLTGSLMLDPNRLVRIHARFPGELVSLGMEPVTPVQGDAERNADAAPDLRPLSYGDKVVKNQLLAVVWSKDIGEKKSELIDAISKRDSDRKVLAQFEAAPDVISGRTIYEARRNYQADEIAVARAERTLRSWRLTEDELQEIRQEAKRVEERKANDPRGDRTWAETDLRSPIDGMIIEKNYNVGDILDPTQDLFKIADLSRLLVQANALEEDLPALRALPPDQRHWRIDIKADPNDVPMTGNFEIVGNIINPAQHSGTVMGLLDNPGGRLSVGAFITAIIPLPPDPSLVVVPTSALVEQGNCSKVFVEVAGEPHHFACRQVAIVTRGRERTYVRAEPRPEQCDGGAKPLVLGERVVQTGAKELAAQLARLQAGEHQD